MVRDPCHVGQQRLFDVARGCGVGRRFGVIRKSSAIWIRARRGAFLVLDVVDRVARRIEGPRRGGQSGGEGASGREGHAGKSLSLNANANGQSHVVRAVHTHIQPEESGFTPSTVRGELAGQCCQCSFPRLPRILALQ